MFSILTVTYNSLTTLKEAYYSLGEQNFEKWEWVVQDGGSSDGTLSWLKSLSDSRVNWVSEPDLGIYDALNKAVKRATGEWVGLLHSDDLYPNNNVLKLVSDATHCADAVYGDLYYTHARDMTKVLRHWRAGLFEQNLIYRGWMPPHPTLFLRKEVYKIIGPFDTQFNIAADYDFILRVFQIPGLKIKYIPTVMMLMRYGGASSKINNLLAKSIEDLKVLRKNNIPHYGFVLSCKIIQKLGQFFIR